MNQAEHAIAAIFTAIIGVAVVSVLVSRNAQTPAVLTSAGNAFSSILRVAVSPVAGGGGGAVTTAPAIQAPQTSAQGATGGSAGGTGQTIGAVIGGLGGLLGSGSGGGSDSSGGAFGGSGVSVGQLAALALL